MKKIKITWFNADPAFIIPNYENAEIKTMKENHEQTGLSPNDAEVIVIDYQTDFEEKHRLKFPKLKAIVTQTSRIDHIKIKKSKISIHAIGGNYCKQAIAEKCKYYAEQLSRNNDKEIRVIGFVGYGTIGQAIAKSFQDKKILFFDPFIKQGEFTGKSPLSEVFSYSDLIILSCPTTSRTKMIVAKKDTFGKKPFIFNIANEVVCHLNTLDHLKEMGKITGYWHDFAPKLITRKSFIQTPHTAWKSIESVKNRHEETLALLEKQFKLVIQHEKLPRMRF